MRNMCETRGAAEIADCADMPADRFGEACQVTKEVGDVDDHFPQVP